MADFECCQQNNDCDYGLIRCFNHVNRVDITDGERLVSLSPETAKEVGRYLALDDIEKLRARIAQLEERCAHYEKLYSLEHDDVERLTAENALLREDKERFKIGGDKAIQLIVQLESIIDNAAGYPSSRRELINELRYAIDAARGGK